jgi:hypothetical protein
MYWWIWWMVAFGGIFGVFTYCGLMNPKGFSKIGDAFHWLQPLTARLEAWFQAKIDEEPIWIVEAAVFSIFAFVAIDVSVWIAFGLVALMVLHAPKTFDADARIVYGQLNALLARFKIAPLAVSWSADEMVIALSARRFLETSLSQLFAVHVAVVASVVIGISLLAGWWAGMTLCVFGTACFLWVLISGEDPSVQEQSVSEETAS